MTALEGFSELDKQLAALAPALSKRILRKSVALAMRPALNRAVETIPVGTVPHKTYKGRLVAPGFARRSLRIVTKGDAAGTTASAALGVRREAFYATAFLELGTAKMAAKPWLIPAFEGTQAKQLDTLRAAMAAGIRGAIGK